MRSDVARLLPATKRYRSLAKFYGADPLRGDSRELDVGLWWREGSRGPLHRAAWVSDTGELYLVRLGPGEGGGGTVEVLAEVESQELLEAGLAGWRERCGAPHSLSWLRERALRLRRRASPDSAAARRRAAAPTALRTRRTAETAA